MEIGSLATIVGTLVAATLVTALSTFTRRVLQPSNNEVKAAEAAASFAVAAVLANTKGGPPIRTSAEDEARRVLIDYAEDLLDEAARIAKRAGADAASLAHVRLAADRLGILRQRASVLADIGLAVGGLALGAASAFGVNLVTGGTAADGTTGWAIGVGAAGLTLFVICATAKWIRR